MNQVLVKAELERYIRQNFLDGDSGLTSTTPLLEWGILTSMNTALLLAFIRDHLGYSVPPASITAANFRDLDSIARLIANLNGSEASTPE
jgi:hypothetical protein